RRWQNDMPGRHITVSVNLSREDLDRPNLCDKIDGMLARYGISPAEFAEQIDQSAYVEDTLRVMKAVEELRGRGFIVEMDDFGSGYSSLNALKDIDIDNDKAFKGIEAIIMSMTPEERDNPEIINGSRRKRIADGSGTNVAEVNKLLKQFETTRKMMKSALTGNLAQRLRGFRR
ncbi:MAG TPA: hypothetical protein DCY24_01290, partial [Rikenellaceae bacterium]|nr:hypothetical protein [Rikenellaceae bacterium]